MSSERLCYFLLFNLCSNSVQKPYTKKHSDDFFAFSFLFVFLPISTLPVEVSSFRELSSLCQYLSALSSHPQDTLFSSDFVLFCFAKFLFLWSWKCTQGLWMVRAKYLWVEVIPRVPTSAQYAKYMPWDTTTGESPVVATRCMISVTHNQECINTATYHAQAPVWQ